MKTQNTVALERLSLYTHFCGLFSIFLGIVVIFIDFLNEDTRHLMVGIYIFAMGYAMAKISSRIAQVLANEQKAS